MDVLIAYATKHGCTEKCAKLLSEKLNGRVDLCNLQEGRVPELTHYDKVVIGGSVYIGRIRKEVTEFCAKNLNILEDKKVGLFICGMRDGDDANTEINTSFPQKLLNAAVAKEHFGGEFIFKNMNFMERFIVKKVSNIDKDMSNILQENINKFAQLVNNA